MKTIKLTLALLTFAICMGSCAMILGIDSNTLMKIQKGMTKEEITSILGQPMHRSFDHEVEGWRYEKSISGAPGITIIDRGWESDLYGFLREVYQSSCSSLSVCGNWWRSPFPSAC